MERRGIAAKKKLREGERDRERVDEREREKRVIKEIRITTTKVPNYCFYMRRNAQPRE